MTFLKHWLSDCPQFLTNLIKKEIVLTIALAAALLTCLFVPPSSAYLGYIDFEVLSCLFCLMLVVAGLSTLNFFPFTAVFLLKRTKNLRVMAATVITLCFFGSMLITNDVVLITFVPFTFTILAMSGRFEDAVPIVVLQTIAANLGSTLTPVGNPQNLYIYSYFQMNPAEFFSAMLPFVGFSALLLCIGLLVIRREPVNTEGLTSTFITSRPKLVIYALLFVLSILGVFDIVPYLLILPIVAAAVLLTDRRLLWTIDYALLATFVCFFIFVGNLSKIPEVAAFIQGAMDGHELIVSALLSQIISNVPAAVLLSGFTEQRIPLLLGVNAGGLGTIIASLASLISYKLFSRNLPTAKVRYLLVFTIFNIAFLLPLLLFCYAVY